MGMDQIADDDVERFMKLRPPPGLKLVGRGVFREADNFGLFADESCFYDPMCMGIKRGALKRERPPQSFGAILLEMRGGRR